MKYYDCNAETGTNDIILSLLLCTRTSVKTLWMAIYSIVGPNICQVFVYCV